MVRVQEEDDLDKPVGVRQLLLDQVAESVNGLDLRGGGVTVSGDHLHRRVQDLRQLLPRWRSCNFDGAQLVSSRNPDLAGTDTEHEVQGADRLLLAWEDVGVADHGLVHGRLVVDEAGDLLSGHHVLTADRFFTI